MEKSAEFAKGRSEEEEDFIIRRPKRSKKSAFKEKLDRVEELVKQLRDMHGNQFSNFSTNCGLKCTMAKLMGR